MVPTKNAVTLDIAALFEQELQNRNEDLRREAALRMFQKLHPTNKTTVDGLLEGLKRQPDVWSVVSTMGVVDFAESLLGHSAEDDKGEPAPVVRRTRLTDGQKSSLKGIIIGVLADTPSGLSRTEISSNINNELLANVGVDRDELANKLRQPLIELLADNKIHTIGEKRLMKYINGPKKTR